MGSEWKGRKKESYKETENRKRWVSANVEKKGGDSSNEKRKERDRGGRGKNTENTERRVPRRREAIWGRYLGRDHIGY